MKQEELIKVAKELNELMQLDPPINLKASAAVVEKKIKEAAAFLTPDDVVTEPTMHALQQLGVWLDQEAPAEEEEEVEEPSPEEKRYIEEGLSLEEEVEQAEKLKDLKDIVQTEKLFEPIRGEVTKYKSAEALRGKMLKMLEPVAEEKPEPAPKPKKEKVKAEKKGPGVIATIVSLIEKSGKKGISKDEIHAELVETFPDRTADSMKNTINVQVPTRISKEKFPVEKLENGNYRKA